MFHYDTKVTMKGLEKIQDLLKTADIQLHALIDTIDEIRKCEFEFGIEIIQPSEKTTVESQLSVDERKVD